MTKDEILHYLKEVEGDLECLPQEVYDTINVISEGQWVAGNKYEHLKGCVIQIKDTETYLKIDLFRAGSSFTDWDYVYQGAIEVKPVKVETTEWVKVED